MYCNSGWKAGEICRGAAFRSDIFFYIDRLMKEGAQVEVTMAFPPQVTLAEPLRVRFLARVVRVEPQNPTYVGVAAAIEEYEFLRSEEQGSAGLQPGWSFGDLSSA